MQNSNKVSEADRFKVSVSMIAALLTEVGVFEVSYIAADQWAHASENQKRKAAIRCRRLASLAARDVHPDIGETKEKAAAIALFAEHLSASHDPSRAFRVAAQCQDIKVPHDYLGLKVGEAIGDVYFLDEFVQMVEGGSVRPHDGTIAETAGIDEFSWDQPRTQMQRVSDPEKSVVRWCNK
jgi:hypothetical protein